jgi:hypothetical protein
VDYYSFEIDIAKPSAIGHVAKRGWVSPDGVVFSGEGEHDSILKRILKTDQKPGSRSGWIRWIASISGTLYIDWSEYGNDRSEDLARAIVKQIDYPFEKIWIDAKNEQGQWVDWQGPIDDFIKFGIKGRRMQFESRLEEMLKSF